MRYFLQEPQLKSLVVNVLRCHWYGSSEESFPASVFYSLNDSGLSECGLDYLCTGVCFKMTKIFFKVSKWISFNFVHFKQTEIVVICRLGSLSNSFKVVDLEQFLNSFSSMFLFLIFGQDAGGDMLNFYGTFSIRMFNSESFFPTTSVF